MLSAFPAYFWPFMLLTLFTAGLILCLDGNPKD